jgi:hypothetical protein
MVKLNIKPLQLNEKRFEFAGYTTIHESNYEEINEI